MSLKPRTFGLIGLGAAIVLGLAYTAMRPDPKTIDGSALASAALHEMETHHITSLFVCDDQRRLEGVIHLHDLWRLELF